MSLEAVVIVIVLLLIQRRLGKILAVQRHQLVVALAGPEEEPEPDPYSNGTVTTTHPSR